MRRRLIARFPLMVDCAERASAISQDAVIPRRLPDLVLPAVAYKMVSAKSFLVECFSRFEKKGWRLASCFQRLAPGDALIFERALPGR